MQAFQSDEKTCSHLKVQGGPSARIVGLVGWFDLDFVCSTLCLVLLGLMGNWQKWLSKWAIWWNLRKQSQPNRGPRPVGTPCTSFFRSYVICIFRVQNNSIHDNGSNAETDPSTAILSIRTSLRGRIRYSTDLGLNSNEET